MRKEMIERIENFSQLENGWLDGEGESFSEITLDNSINLVRQSPNEFLEKTNVFPSWDGAIQFEFSDDDFFYDIQVEKDGSFSFYKMYQESEKNEIEQKVFSSLNELLTFLKGG